MDIRRRRRVWRALLGLMKCLRFRLGRRLCMDPCETRLLRYKLVDVGEIRQKICGRGASKYLFIFMYVINLICC